MLKKTILYTLLAVVVLGVVAGFVAWQQFYGNALEGEKKLYIGTETTYAQLTDSLMPAVKHRRAFDYYARRINLERSFKPGYYQLEPGMSVIEIARALKLGLQTPVKVRINNVRLPSQLAGKLAGQLEADSVAFLEAITSQELAESVGFDSTTLFSMFIPNTYEMYWTTSPEEFVKRMKREYVAFWTPERDALRSRSGLSRLDVMTLASIVNEETAHNDEMPRIAGVYVNRLKKNMRLQACPTIKYAMQDFELKRVLYKHLTYDSPYNTYKNFGLPPSPICMPSIVAIDAVLNYEVNDYLYFCARPTFDGYNDFSKTLDQHNRYAKAYARALDSLNIK